jgi:hypothetical protein
MMYGGQLKELQTLGLSGGSFAQENRKETRALEGPQRLRYAADGAEQTLIARLQDAQPQPIGTKILARAVEHMNQLRRDAVI